VRCAQAPSVLVVRHSIHFCNSSSIGIQPTPASPVFGPRMGAFAFGPLQARSINRPGARSRWAEHFPDLGLEARQDAHHSKQRGMHPADPK